MKNCIFILVIQLIIFQAFASGRNEHPLFWSPKAYEYQMTYDFYVQFKSTTTPTVAYAKTEIEKQVTYLFGALSNNIRTGTPKASHTIEMKSLKALSSQVWQANYHYTGLVEISDGPNTHQFYLPIQIDDVYRKGIVVAEDRYLYPCGDNDHWQEEYFWYFFNPTAPGCRLKNQKDYAIVSAQLSALQSTVKTYPEYERLAQNGVLRIDILFGMNDSSEDLNPLHSRDLNGDSYRRIYNYLLKRGYQISQQNDSSAILVKKSSYANLEVHLFFGPNALFNSYEFQKHFADAIANGGVVIYAGHSGLGDYLSLNKIYEVSGIQIQAPQNRYQIYFFNGCSTYPYYNQQYFALKQTVQDPNGTLNLDIITNGLATLFSAIVPSTGAVLQGVETWAETGVKTSYQEIVAKANSNNLIAINGDEDNP